MTRKGLWKHSSSLFENNTNTENMKNHIITILTKFKNESSPDEQWVHDF